MRRIFVVIWGLFALITAGTIVSSETFAQEIPSFKVTGKNVTSLSILVPSNTTKEQLKNLINKFREARKGNNLSKMIPPTTRGGVKGDYGIVMLFIFAEPEWASEDKLKKSFTVNPKDPFYKEYSKHIKAYYYYAAAIEEGSIGYAEDGLPYTPIYEKLF